MSLGPVSHVPNGSLGRALASARLWAAGHYPYTSVALFALGAVEVDGPVMLAVDSRWRLITHPAIVEGWTTAELGTALLHQVEHLRRRHAVRGEEFLAGGTQLVWQLAADAEINDDLARDGLPLASPAVTPRLLGAPDGLLAEEYAVRLGHEHGTRAELRALLGDRPCCGTYLLTPAMVPQEGLPPGLDPAEVDLLGQQVELGAMVVRGESAASVTRVGGTDDEERVDWRQVLGRVLRTSASTTMGYADYTYKRPSRRNATTPGVILPALRQPKPMVAVVVDTSGSVSSAALAMALAEVQSVVAQVGSRLCQLWVLTCDAEIHDVRSVRSPGELGRLPLTGGGGTDMRVGISAATKLRPAPEVVLVLTDGQTPWPERPGRERLVVGLVGVGQRPPGLPPWATVMEIGALTSRATVRTETTRATRL